mgnify:CR=1 FL=1
MHGGRADARAWADAARAMAGQTGNEVALFPPYPWLDLVIEAVGGPEAPVVVGGQACHPEPSGAFTGAVAASMLAELGCRAVLCGHSERRHVFGETDAFVAGSLAAALEAGLVPVLCVGEKEDEREAGQTEAVVARQLDAGLAALRSGQDPLIVAYEPVWAIGTGKAATPKEAAEAHAFIRARIAEQDPERAATVRILYGGSVKPSNIAGFLAVPDVDGALVGGAALDPETFAPIACAKAGAADA